RNLYSKYRDIESFGRINIGNNVFSGYGVIIMPNTWIGDNIIIGAGSIVKGKLENNSVYAGVPTKRICSIEEFKERNVENFLSTKGLNRKEKKAFLLKTL
ncbi:MAG TPA: acyltransferase, partial [Campylobacterales bacterium]|nr:acyltransferase [Campylobacterales bacterium]